jgi:hypothetical protein
MASTPLGHEKTDTHLLTHIAWNSMPEYFSYGSNETGIRDIRDGKVVEGTFRLIQHGWTDWQWAGEIIKRLLAKGKDDYKIFKLMDYMKDRKWHKRPQQMVQQESS